ncbi:hypothetical protein ABZ599_18160 [Streptomyces misionensis]|uniref:hypothetical protein n=1 Tax=Streptomyces misionensis TaxID=67331 RepID=UPI0033C98281
MDPRRSRPARGAGGLPQNLSLARAHTGIRSLRLADDPDKVHETILVPAGPSRRAAADPLQPLPTTARSHP